MAKTKRVAPLETASLDGLPLKRTFFSVLIAATVGSFPTGYALGFPSTALVDLRELKNDRAFKTGSVEAQFFVAFVAAGAIPGSVLGAQCSDRVGRRAALLAAGVLGVIGWMLIFIAQYTETSFTFKTYLLLGRLVTGASAGASDSIISVYVAEISPSNRRGLLCTFTIVTLSCGIFLSYLIGAIPGLCYTHSALVITGILMVFLPLMFVIKESPRWLLMKGNRSGARKSLLWLFRSAEYVDKIFRCIESSLPTKKVTFSEKMKMFTQRTIYHPFILAIFIMIFFECTGIDVIITYAASVFQAARVENAEETAVYALGALQMVGTIISAFVVDKYGRKKLLLFGSIGIALSNAALGTHFFIIETTQCNNNSLFSNETITEYDLNSTKVDGDLSCYPSLLSILPIISVMGFGLFYSIGWRALPFIMLGEMFPTSIRGTISGILVAFQKILLAILVGGFTPYESAVGPYTAWWVFAGITALSIPFIAILLPETKGKTLEVVEQFFGKKRKVCVITTASNSMLAEELRNL